MNLSDYIKELQKLEAQGYGDKPVLLLETYNNTYHEASSYGIRATDYARYRDDLGMVKESPAVALTI
jgi:hypothetical protein